MLKTTEFMLTVAMGKRLIARGLMAEKSVLNAMQSHRLLILAGTTNAYVAQEALRVLGENIPFDVRTYHRGMTIAPGARVTPGNTSFDLLIDHGKACFDRTVFEIAPEMQAGDMIMKGANALYLPSGEAGVLIGHPQGGTLIPIIAAAIGRRVSLIAPVGLEKRVDQPIARLCSLVNSDQSEGPRLSPLPGRAYTELDALRALTGVEDVQLLAAGGVMGAEGAVYLAATGEESALENVRTLVRSLRDEPPISL